MTEIELPPAGEDLAALAPLYMGDDDRVYVMRATSAAPRQFAGLARRAVIAGDQVTAIREGEIVNADWNWSLATRNLFVGDGELTQARPAGGRVVKVGFVVRRDTIVIGLPILDVKLA